MVYGLTGVVDDKNKTVTLKFKCKCIPNQSEKAFYFAESYIKAKLPDYKVIIDN